MNTQRKELITLPLNHTNEEFKNKIKIKKVRTTSIVEPKLRNQI